MVLSKQISLHAYTLTEMEKQLLRNLLDYSDEFEYKNFTIEFISEQFNVSKTSVHRFTQKLGYESFVYFKDDYFNRDVMSKTSQEEPNQYVDMLKHTYELVNDSISEDLLIAMIQAKRIVIYGMGMSNFLGKMFQIKLQLFGKTVEQFDDSRYMRLSAKSLNSKEDLVFVLSRSGKPPEIVEAIIEANFRKVKIVLITEEPKSPLGGLSDFIIQTSFSKDSDQAIDTRINAHVALDVLMNRFIERKEKEVLENDTKSIDPQQGE
ncbi:MurR/RpiR family transcriptional regulator [Erysipelothrix urinaevulpis]|uniref:MurR/RpiR family transcriptional regulator n=1 Tax=Erysipelothrix urinaevulpis TaxID=2683717 RepID=UPI001356894B|nr:MurR/RpiR family transcriptional regulator [Erysipelothrix urinaevulpis]